MPGADVVIGWMKDDGTTVFHVCCIYDKNFGIYKALNLKEIVFFANTYIDYS